ncbi:MAG: PKD domain-containing protein, partial [Bacteroidota bacterium]
FEVTLTSTLPTGCFGDSTRTIRVSPVPVADFTIDTLAFDCDNMRILVEASRQGYNNYEWEVRQNGVVTLASSSIGSSFELPFDLLASDLPVDITLRTTNFADCESELGTGGIVIPAKKNINAAFNVTPLEQSLPDATVFFENLTSAGPWTYEWDFGDGNTSDDPNIASHTYTTFGTYTITLSVSDQECVETAVQTITINPVPPVVDFTYDPGAGCPPLTVQFTNLSQFADPSSYFWEFGANQGTSRAEDPQYTYFEAGTYTVSLSAANILGDTVREVKTMIIEVYEKPVALFDIRPFIVFIPDNPIFTDNNSFSASSYFWDFGDGTTSTDPEPTHTYEELGVFDVTLIASNEFGCTDTLTRESIVETRVGGRVLVPNAFTPNLSGPIGGAAGRGGTNDVFLPVMEGVSEFEMQVFNRWGELLFETRNKNIGWDGYYQGKLSPQDVYIYKLSVVFQNGESTVRTGDINLIR